MPILAVSSNLVQMVKKQEVSTKPETATPVKGQNNNLVDSSYGRSIINMNKISFRGNLQTSTLDLSKKVSAVFKVLTDADILLIGKDLGTAVQGLTNSKVVKECLFKKLFFIPDDSIKSVVAIKKNTQGFDEITNLADTKLFIQKYSRDGELSFLEKYQQAAIQEADYISTKHPEYGFYLVKNEIAQLTDIPENEIQVLSLYNDSASEKMGELISKLNIKNIEAMNVATINSPKKITFADVGGQDEAIAEIKRKILYQLKFPNYFKNNINGGAHGALFVGPPGNGKSLAALATANEAGVKFFYINPQYFKSMWDGKTQENIGKEFQNIEKINLV